MASKPRLCNRERCSHQLDLSLQSSMCSYEKNLTAANQILRIDGHRLKQSKGKLHKRYKKPTAVSLRPILHCLLLTRVKLKLEGFTSLKSIPYLTELLYGAKREIVGAREPVCLNP